MNLNPLLKILSIWFQWIPLHILKMKKILMNSTTYTKKEKVTCYKKKSCR